MTTGFPRNWAMSTVWPLPTAFRAKSGAGRPTSGESIWDGSLPSERKNTATSASVPGDREMGDGRLPVRLAPLLRAGEGHRVLAHRRALALAELEFPRHAHRAAHGDGDDHDYRAGVHEIRSEAATAAAQLG